MNGRNTEYLIDRAMVKTDKTGEPAFQHSSFMYTWGPVSERMDRFPLQRLVIDEKAGPLPPGTGLYVHAAGRDGKRHYAVVTCRKLKITKAPHRLTLTPAQ